MTKNSRNKTVVVKSDITHFTEQDYCKSRPCKNGGDCINTASGHTCNCKNGYVGNNCDRESVGKCQIIQYCHVFGYNHGNMFQNHLNSV